MSLFFDAHLPDHGVIDEMTSHSSFSMISRDRCIFFVKISENPVSSQKEVKHLCFVWL